MFGTYGVITVMLLRQQWAEAAVKAGLRATDEATAKYPVVLGQLEVGARAGFA